MRNVYYIVGAVILALIGLGIYTSRAEEATNNLNDGGVIIIEEEGYAVEPANNSAKGNNKANNNNKQGMASGNNVSNSNMPNANMPNSNSNSNTMSNNSNGGFQPLASDPGVEVAPDNQPVVDRAMKNQNPNYNNGTVVIEEDVVESSN